MRRRFSAYLSIFNDWDLLGPALRSLAGRIDELVVVDGAYQWMTPFLEKIGIDPDRSDGRVMEAIRACGVPTKIVTGLWKNEIDKRVAGYQACDSRYVYRIDADEVLFFHDLALQEFLDQGGAVGQMEMPITVAPGWIRANGPGTELERQALLFDRDQISPEEHLHYLWLVLGEDVLPPPRRPRRPEFPRPIAFNAHLTHWRTPETSVNRSSFYTLNYLRHYGASWIAEADRRPIADFSRFFDQLDAQEFRQSLHLTDLTTGQVAMAQGGELRVSPTGPEADARLAVIHERFLNSLADLNRSLATGFRGFLVDRPIVIDLSTEGATRAVVVDRQMTLNFPANFSSARVDIRYLVPTEPWEVIIQPSMRRVGNNMMVLLPTDEPRQYLRRCLEIKIEPIDFSPIQKLSCLMPDSPPSHSSPFDEAKLVDNEMSECRPPLLRHVNRESMLRWFEEHGGDTDRHYLSIHFDRMRAVRDFALRHAVAGAWKRMAVLDIGAHWLHQALLFANEGHDLLCADLPGTIEYAPVQESARAMGAKLLVYQRLDRGEGLWELPESSIDLVLFCEILAHLPFNPITLWRAIHRALKPGGRIILSTPNGTNLLTTKQRLDALVATGQMGLNVAEIFATGTFGHQWKEYSIKEIKAYFATLSSDFVVTDWKAWGSDVGEITSSLKILVGEADASPTAPLDPVVTILRRMVREGHPMLGQALFAEISLVEKRAGIAIRPPWET